ncbi:MAG: hypothetical protein JWO96_443 [Candidatus Saccharibacteria bacterium]|nr:hypothetical protein [Candidatus Saccharibacteria bacterium]
MAAAVLLSAAILAGSAHADTNAVLATLVTPASPEDTTTIDQRLAARKIAYKDQLPSDQNASIAAKCTLAQTALADIKTKDVKAAAIRLEAYSALAKRLSYLVDNLSSQGVDATALLNAQNKFVISLNTYIVDAGNYKAAIDDAVNVDCKKDPAGFRASLLETRKLRTLLATDVASAKSNLSSLRKAASDERQLLIKNPGKVTAGTVGTVGTRPKQ